jgi:hypothetical protein
VTKTGLNSFCRERVLNACIQNAEANNHACTHLSTLDYPAGPSFFLDLMTDQVKIQVLHELRATLKHTPNTYGPESWEN